MMDVNFDDFIKCNYLVSDACFFENAFEALLFHIALLLLTCLRPRHFKFECLLL